VTKQKGFLYNVDTSKTERKCHTAKFPFSRGHRFNCFFSLKNFQTKNELILTQNDNPSVTARPGHSGDDNRLDEFDGVEKNSAKILFFGRNDQRTKFFNGSPPVRQRINTREKKKFHNFKLLLGFFFSDHKRRQLFSVKIFDKLFNCFSK